ncbi:MAG: porin [Epsilonproteobacteria bacterium]|nr:porin [Campylobacterota bacterium]
MRKDVEALKIRDQEMKQAFEGNSKAGFNIAGYASIDYANEENGIGSFLGIKFAPIFHAQYGDIFQFEGEVEFTTNSEGETETELEYAAGTLFINDYMGLQMGKFMSPLGQFVQNMHPSWINKLPSAPVGFGHDGAAPTSNLGVALRGGLPKMADIRSNYALFISNAPTFGVADDGDVVIGAEGKTGTFDNAYILGGRYAINPVGNMEIGLSLATGDITEALASGEDVTHNYDVFGTDMMWNIDSFSIKAEYIQQKIGENERSLLEGGTWKAWYTQVSYQFDSVKLEPVLRYSDYNNPEVNKNQVALGLNYLFANNLIAKLAYEINTDKDNSDVDSSANNNRLLAQFAFGF